MIEAPIIAPPVPPETKRVLTYVKNERMGGYIPKYEIVKQNTPSQSSETAMTGSQGHDTLSTAPASQALNEDEQFGFGDLIDMVNPLHHIPVVGHVYREISGDQIKPISKIMGSAAFGGPLGVATALVDTVVMQETGHDMAGNAMNLAFGNKKQETAPVQIASNDPEKVIENAMNTVNDPEMTSALLAYSDLGHKNEEVLKYEAYKRVENNMHQAETTREPITKVSFSKTGGLYSL